MMASNRDMNIMREVVDDDDGEDDDDDDALGSGWRRDNKS